MIKLKKTSAPKILVDKEATWTKTIVDRISKGEKPTETERTRYRHPDIKKALISETFGKCAYCESKLLHIAYGDIEHIHPKSEDANNIFKWENLTLACDRCNTEKGIIRSIVDPYINEPSNFFEFLGPMVIPDPKNEIAVVTERSLKLNRLELMERRSDKIKYLASQLLILSHTKNQELKDVLRKDLLLNETSESQEFAATARSFLKTMIGKV
jgi:uncharacterized protein (TIGR02646 family)